MLPAPFTQDARPEEWAWRSLWRPGEIRTPGLASRGALSRPRAIPGAVPFSTARRRLRTTRHVQRRTCVAGCGERRGRNAAVDWELDLSSVCLAAARCNDSTSSPFLQMRQIPGIPFKYKERSHLGARLCSAAAPEGGRMRGQAATLHGTGPCRHDRDGPAGVRRSRPEAGSQGRLP